MRSKWLAYGHPNRDDVGLGSLLCKACGARVPAVGLGSCGCLKPAAIGLDPVTMRLEPLVYARAVWAVHRGAGRSRAGREVTFSVTILDAFEYFGARLPLDSAIACPL